MKVYYLNAEYQPGKHRILAANFDRDEFSWNNTINVPYSILEIDEVDPENKDACIDLVRMHGLSDINNEGKYYIDEDGDLCVVDGWEEYKEEEL